MKMQDCQFIQWLDEHGIEDYELLEANERKGRYCISYEIFGEKRFLKWNKSDSDVHREHACLLRKEQSIYQELKGKNISPAFRIINGVFSIDFVQDAKTLRKKIKELSTDKSNSETLFLLVKNILSKWQLFVNTLSSSDIENPRVVVPVEEYRRYLQTLLLSGPFETKKLGSLEIKINRLIYRIFQKFFEKRICLLLSSIHYLRTPVTHGDFHANNVLVGKHNSYIVDYESVQMGCPELELAYMYAQICLLIRNKHQLINRLDDYIREEITVVSNMNIFFEILSVYKKAIRFNRRFY